MLPKEYLWLNKEPGPRILLEALRLFGTLETPGAGDNPVILKWADELGADIKNVYSHDAIPWCGLFMAICAKRAGFMPPPSPLWALSWAKFGTPVKIPALGDILTFKRDGGGHVAMYIGEDQDCYHILGGNQSDQVCIRRKPKAELYAARRCPWAVAQPLNVRRVFLSPAGVAAGSEA